ncbi:MAG: PAAR domain-containing protein [Selenomonadaceae bacterium]|nr:PAAR domain-containing protein [Selenomonadaceae bacterium]
MASASRLGDIGGSHDACPARPIITAGDDVFINGRGAARYQDQLAVHSCFIHPPHPGNIAGGSTTVFINGRAAARIGDAVSCGGQLAEGSHNVFIGD